MVSQGILAYKSFTRFPSPQYPRNSKGALFATIWKNKGTHWV